MSLETLLEAAKYIEYRSEAKARGEVPKDYNSFIGYSSSVDNNGGSVFLLPSYSSSNNDDNSPTYYDNDHKDRRRSGGAGTREVHNKLEKNRRAHLKKCFETLKKQIPNVDDKKTSNLGVLRSAFRYIQTLKRREREYEFEVERLAREKVVLQQRLSLLRRELSSNLDHIDINTLLRDPDNDTNSTSTATECGPLSDIDDDKISDISQESVSVPALDGTEKDVDVGMSASMDAHLKSATNGKAKPSVASLKTSDVVSPASAVVGVHSLPNTSPPKVAPVQHAPTVGKPIQSHSKIPVINLFTVMPAMSPAANTDCKVKTVPQISSGTLPLRATLPTQAAPPGATNGNSVPVLAAAAKVLAQPTVRILAPVAAATATKPQALAPSVSAALASARVALASSSSVVSAAVPLTTFTLGKAMPTIKRVATLTPVSNAVVTSAVTAAAKAVSAVGTPLNPVAIAQLTVKPNSALAQQPMLTATTVSFQGAAPIVTSSPSVSAPVNTVARQLVAATLKPVAQMGQVRSPLTQLTQVMAPTTLVSSGGQVIPAGSHVSSVTPMLAPMSVMTSMNHAAVAQVISPSQLGKVITTPFIKTVPIYQQQLFPHLGKPVVMVPTSNVVPASTTAQVTLPGSR